MRFIIVLFAALLGYSCSIAQSGERTTMHRLQDTTKNAEGLYYGKSTEGHFSVLLPIPFNDFTITTDGLAMHAIGGRTSEGIKFVVTEMSKKDRKKPIDLNSFTEDFKRPSSTITNIRKGSVNGAEFISFSVADKESGAMLKYVLSKKALYVMIIEYPIRYKTMVEERFSYFFSSLKITE